MWELDIWKLDKLILFIAFVIPGLISVKLYELFYPCAPKDTRQQITDAITYSCVNYALLSWLIILLEIKGIRNSHPILYGLFCLFVLFVMPAILTYAWKLIRETDFMQRRAPHPTGKPWDYVFLKRESYLVKVSLRDGTKLGGKYAEKSFTSSTPAEEQIYLEESWILNEQGGLERPENRTKGILILGSDISYLEFMSDKEGESDER